ncbi:MAG TPA: alpha-L-arabinofuranosidase [Planctomycetes bacterium]|nr:alpha-L-arabinofuranosidase [Planctomycetota bacterium]
MRTGHALVVVVLAACAALSGGEAVNSLPNPSFENAAGDGPAGWKPATWGGRAAFEHGAAGRTGGRSAVIASAEGADVSWTATVPVKPFSVYRLSGWVKTDNVAVRGGLGALFNLHNMQGTKTPAVTGTKDWTRLEVVFETSDHDSIQVNCLFGGWGLATGRAWYDDVALELLDTKALEPAVAIDAGRTFEPMSPYIYGQFIEHLGRCIYGGIWAEMLEDRKFFYAAGRRESPWKPFGERAAVAMHTEAPLAGAHAVELRPSADGAPAGIAQDGLGLIAGKEYVGRLAVAGSAGSGPVTVSLVWGPGENDRQRIEIAGLSADYAKKPFRFTAGASTDDGRLEIGAAPRAGGSVRIGAVSLMPADHVSGMRPDTLALLKELNAPIYRWPGGNFVSGYDWKDGLGDPDRRPPRKNPAWRGVEHNDFGINEFMTFCRVLGTEPLIVVNSGLGDVALATSAVEYANGAPDTPMGRLRASHGRAEPYKVLWWGIGNEMYGNWQLGHMPLSQYVEKHNVFARAMHAVDPSLKFVAVGAVGAWSETMLKNCADNMHLMSEHFYCGAQGGLLSHARQIPDNIRRIADAHRRYRASIPALAGKDIRIAMDEWNYWYGPHPYGELGTQYFLKDALGIAAGLNEYSRATDIIFMANYAQTVNVIGCIKTTKTAAAFDTTGLVLALYRARFGVVPVAVEGSPAPLDIAAAWTDGRTALTISVVNPTLSPATVATTLAGAALASAGTAYVLTGPSPDACNVPGKPPQVTVVERAATLGDALEVPAMSATVFVFPAR